MQPKVKAVMGSPITQVIQPGHAHFAMVEKTALHNLDELMRLDMQAARLIVSLIRLMEPGSGGVVVMSRASMAELLGVSARTLQNWEQGRTRPSGAAQTLLAVAQRHPEVLRELVA